MSDNTPEVVEFAKDFVEARCLFWYDGPVLSHYRDQATGDDFMVVWTDVDAEAHSWHAVKVSREDLGAYYRREITLLEVERRSPAIYACRGDFVDGTTARGVLTPFADIAPEHLPTEDSFLDGIETPEEFRIESPAPRRARTFFKP